MCQSSISYILSNAMSVKKEHRAAIWKGLHDVLNDAAVFLGTSSLPGKITSTLTPK